MVIIENYHLLNVICCMHNCSLKTTSKEGSEVPLILHANEAMPLSFKFLNLAEVIEAYRGVKMI